MDRRPTRIGIRTRFVLVISALIALTCLVFSIFFVHREKELATQILASQGTILAKSLAVEVRLAGPRLSREQLESVLNQFLNREGVVFCTIRDGVNHTVAEARRRIDPRQGEQILTFSYPASGHGPGRSLLPDPGWTASIGLSGSAWTHRIEDLKRTAVWLALLLLAFGVGATLLTLQMIIKPIRVLLDATQKIARGELDDPVRIVSSGEIRELSETLSEMAGEWEQSHSQLEEYSKTLERKVERRTGELEKRVRDLSDSRRATLNILEDVKEAKTDLERVNAELLALDEMKSKFIGTISHELKTPFTAIKANIDFVTSGKEGQVPENLNQHLVTIQRNTNRVQKIMEDFLTVAQIHSDRRHLEPEHLKLGAMVREYLAEIGPIDKKFQVQVEISDDISVFADPNRLHDIYVNLLLNALKFSPQGGEIKVSARPHDGQILSEVSDQGVGIAPDKLEHIFEAFYQIDRKKYGGTGLGLSIVQGIIHEHGGRIWVDSRPGEGSIFFFTLPSSGDGQHEPVGTSGEGSHR